MRSQRKLGRDFASLPMVFVLLWPCLPRIKAHVCFGSGDSWVLALQVMGCLRPNQSPWATSIPSVCMGINQSLLNVLRLCASKAM